MICLVAQGIRRTASIQMDQSSGPTPNSPDSYRVLIGTPRCSAIIPISCCPTSLSSLYCCSSSERVRSGSWLEASPGFASVLYNS